MNKELKLHDNEFGRIHTRQLDSGQEILVLEHDRCSAELCLYGGQVLLWQPRDQWPVFWLSRDASYQHGKSIMGGVPVCWPWFGQVDGLGLHGFVDQLDWQLSATDVEEDGIRIRLELSASNQTQSDLPWARDYLLEQSLFFGAEFEQEFLINNMAAETRSFSGALHSYFVVSDPAKTIIEGLNGARFQDKLENFAWGSAEGEVSAKGPVDRIFHSTESASIVDHGLGRRIRIDKSGSKQWTLWNPGPEWVKEFGDIHAGGEQEFVCLEAANTEAVSIAAGGSFRCTQSVKIEDL